MSKEDEGKEGEDDEEEGEAAQIVVVLAPWMEGGRLGGPARVAPSSLGVLGGGRGRS